MHQPEDAGSVNVHQNVFTIKLVALIYNILISGFV